MGLARAKLGILGIFFLGLLVCTSAQADPLGMYVGAGGGRSDLRVDGYLQCGVGGACPNETATGWTVFAGLQPLPFLGAELQYLDFGDTAHIYPYHKHARALAVFGKATLPLPFVDVYAKAGVGRLQTNSYIVTNDPNQCVDTGNDCDLQVHSTAERFGWGLGAEYKLSSLAIRAEYVQFSASNGNSAIATLALLWRF